MYATHSINGAHLPHKTLCLTYDDGPGVHTLAIAQFLYEQQIRATFFVVGKYAVEQQATLAQLQAMGHIIGNHTYDHPDLPYYVSINGDVQNQVLRTDAVIKPFVNQPTFFRVPYGKWSVEVANELNSNLLCAVNHFGPIHWDIAGIDCYYWQLEKSVAETVESYRNTIREVGKGIVVMH
ncbi:MAG: polysaccharide deacetylase family protein, partial [Sphingobacteriaceae bacterium]